MSRRIGYVGLGNMGAPMFLNLARYCRTNDLPPPRGWNIDQTRYDELRAMEAHLSLQQDLSEVVSGSDIVFTCLLNDPVALDVYDKLLAFQGASGVIFVDQSSLKPSTSRTLHAAAERAGAVYLAAPVFGRPDAAKAASLVHVLAGSPDAKALVAPMIVPALATRIVDAGPDVAKGNALKLLGNSMILGIVEMLSETFAVVDAIGFDRDVYQSFISDFFPLYPFIAYGDNISKGNFSRPGGFRLEAGLKDARNILNLGADFGRPTKLPTIALALEHLERAEALCGNDVDWSALALALREKAGLDEITPVTEANGHPTP